MSWIVRGSPIMRLFQPMRDDANRKEYVAVIVRNMQGQGDALLTAMAAGAYERGMVSVTDPTRTYEARHLKMNPEGWFPVRDARDMWEKLRVLEQQAPEWGETEVIHTGRENASEEPIAQQEREEDAEPDESAEHDDDDIRDDRMRGALEAAQSRFPVGTRVWLSETGRDHWGNQDHQDGVPAGGRVRRAPNHDGNEIWLEVLWNNGDTNSYHPEDLDLV